MASIGAVQIDFVAGLAGFQRSLDQMAGSLGGVERTLNSAFSSVRNIVGAISFGVVIREAVQLADAFANVTARLKLATAATGDFEQTFQEVFAIAQRTSTDLAETANLYGKVSSALRSFGQDAGAAAGIVETINQTLALSGASAASSAAAITQLNQALASGVLRGEEFNSVSEQAPILLKGIADQLGVTIGQLRAFAAEGKLTTDVVIGAIQGIGPRIADQFSQLPLTVGRAFQQVKNEVLVAVGEIDQELNSSKALAGFVQSVGAGIRELSISLRNSIPDIAGYVQALGAIIAALTGLAGLRLVVSIIERSSAAIAAASASQRTAILAAAAATETATGAAIRQTTAEANATAAILAKAQAGLKVIEQQRAEALVRLDVARATVAQNASQANQNLLSKTFAATGTTLEKLLTRETALRQQIAGATAAQTAAQTALNAAQASALGVGARLTAGLSSLGAGLLGLVGGPIGATILALGGLVFWLSRASAEQERVRQQTISATEAFNQFSIAAQQGTLGQIDFAAGTKAIQEQKDQIQALREELDRLQSTSFGDINLLGGPSKTIGTQEEISAVITKINQAEGALAQLERAAQLAADRGLSALGGKLRELFAGESKTAPVEFGLSVADLDKRLAGYAKNLDPIADAQKRFAEELAAAAKAGKSAADIEIIKRGQAQELDKLRKSLAGYKREAKEATDAQRALERAVADGVSVYERLREQFDPLGALAARQARELIALSKAYAAEELSIEEVAEAAAQLQREFAKAGQERADSIQLVEQETDSVEELIRSLEREIQVQAAQNVGDREKIRLLEIEERLRREIASLPDERQASLTDDERKRIRESITAAYDEAQRQAFDFGQSLSDAIDEAFRSGSLTKGFRSFIDKLKEAFSGGFRSSAQAVNSALQFAQPIVDAIRNSDGNRAGSGLRALNSQLAASGNVFAQIAQSVDAIFGGRLFGTDFERNRSGLNVSFGASGFTGSTFLEETRQRSFFRGTARRTTTEPLDQSTERALRDFFKQINAAVALAARDLGVTVPNLIQGAFREVTDKNGKVIEQFSTVLGRQFKESFEEFQQRVLAENIIATIDQLFRTVAEGITPPEAPVDPDNPIDPGRPDPFIDAIKSAQAFQGEASAIAERWRADAQTLLEGAQFLLAAATDIRDGTGLLGEGGTLTQIADLIEELQAPGEVLADTYARVYQSTQLFERALDLAGITLDSTREEFVRFATDITDAAGGLERASQLWASYYNTFYTETERAQLQFEQATQNLTDELADIELDPETTKEQLRAIFEDALAAGTLSPEQIVQYLEAAAAFEALDVAASAVADAAAEATQALEDQAAALVDYTEFIGGIDRQLRDLDGASEFVQSIRGIEDEFEQNIRTANDLARAAGLQGASEQDLIKIHELAARRVAAAIAQLRGRIQGLVSQLYNPVDALDARIEELQASIESSSSAEIGAIGEVAQAQQDRYEAEIQAIKDIQGFLDSLRLDTSLTTLTPQERLGEAQSQFAELLAAAQGGDIEALQQLSGAAQAYLREARSFFASGDDYTRIFDFVTGALGALRPTGVPLEQTPGGNGGGGFIDTAASAELAQLQAERDQLQREAEAAQRQALALELIGFLRELAAATGDDILALAASFNIPLETLVTDLGVNLDSVTAETTLTLAGIAQSLGLELTDLARSVGIDLGALADEQSLLNDALEEQIASLPPDSAAALQPFLDDIEAATTDADANAAIQELIDEAERQPAEIQRLLAPFLDGLDIADEFEDLDFLESISTAGDRTAIAAESIDLYVQEILAKLSAPETPVVGEDTKEATKGEVEIVRAIENMDRSNQSSLAALSARVTALEQAQNRSVNEQVNLRNTIVKARA